MTAVPLCGYLTTTLLTVAMLAIALHEPSVPALFADLIESAATWAVSILRAHSQARYASRAAYKSVYRHFRRGGGSVIRPDELIVDNFAGGGGASTAIESALGRPVDIAINHDPEAIAMHAANHPKTLHLCESVWKVDIASVVAGRPVGFACFSPDCKHFSKAKGGKPVEKRIRGLAWVALKWAGLVKPRIIMLENVEEFQDWGPLVGGKPCPRRKGMTFKRWVTQLRNLGYAVDWREMRACAFGAPTIRKRLFIVARRDVEVIPWPEETHAKTGDLFLKPYRTAAECIDWSIPCPSIFLTREDGRAIGVNRPLAEATMRRIARGVKRYVIDAAEPFIVPIAHYNGSDTCQPTSQPLRTVTASPKGGSHALVTPFLASLTHHGENRTEDQCMAMPADSVHLILTSIPFSTQYEYTPSFRDFGHTDSNEHFFEQMDFLTPELLRILKPGLVAAIHVKDRIVPGGMTGLGFQTVYPFHCECISHFVSHGFAYLGMKTIVTDVVRENNQTYRLGWTEQCKDGSRMGVGMPEYLLLFRKPPTDQSNGYADEPVVKDKPLCVTEDGRVVPFDTDLGIKPGTGYSRFVWQTDAHGFARSSGNRLLSASEMRSLPHEKIFKLFRQHSLNNVYDYAGDVALGEALEAEMRLPVTFMLLQPQSWHPDVWTDITRMLTLNGAQHSAGREMHLCPIQFDLADRVIRQFSMPGETVFDPFAGIGSVPYRAILMGRRGHGVELSTGYWLDSLVYCRAAEQKVSMPTLFDLEATA